MSNFIFFRYDLLCLEGLARSLRAFLKVSAPPTYKLLAPSHTILVDPSVSKVRGVILGAVLRNVKFDTSNYNSFIEFQDKLHENICRKRKLASIGTHDLDTIKGPFIYSAQKPEDIVFQALSQTKVTNAKELMDILNDGSHLKPYLHLIENEPLYPVLRDSDGTVLSLPPIINGEHSKITLDTKNVFIEVTATDITRAKIVLDMMTTMFSEYSKDKFTIEQVTVHYKAENKKTITPTWEPYECSTSVDYVNGCLGLNLSGNDIIQLLKKMCLEDSKLSSDKKKIVTLIPPTRPDILHPCDVMEDAAIAYGFNNLQKQFPKTSTSGHLQPVNKLSIKVRHELSRCGYHEVLSLTLVSIFSKKWMIVFNNV